ncbi:hypothetical protein [Haliangium ochraceum]|uniref:hypothetical protein n=1 Tax=Haliangium ochraceum TaxID=80816 RepID=UPI000307A4BE|nr:hypothetical protein [Haliangium ochraceum]
MYAAIFFAPFGHASETSSAGDSSPSAAPPTDARGLVDGGFGIGEVEPDVLIEGIGAVAGWPALVTVKGEAMSNELSVSLAGAIEFDDVPVEVSADGKRAAFSVRVPVLDDLADKERRDLSVTFRQAGEAWAAARALAARATALAVAAIAPWARPRARTAAPPAARRPAASRWCP